MMARNRVQSWCIKLIKNLQYLTSHFVTFSIYLSVHLLYGHPLYEYNSNLLNQLLILLLIYCIMPFDSLGNIRSQEKHLSKGRGSGRSSSAKPKSYGLPSTQRQHFCDKSVLVDPLFATLVDSSKGPAWWHCKEAHGVHGRSITISVSWYQTR